MNGGPPVSSAPGVFHVYAWPVTDAFIDRVSELAGRTARVLDQLAEAVADADVGLDAQVDQIRAVANEHRKIALDCLSETQPIALRRVSLGRQLRDLAEESRQVAAELLQRGIHGHTEVSEAADQLEAVADQADTV